MRQTLLQAFIEKKKAEGSIHLPVANKFEASLLSGLTNKPLQEVAAEVGFTHGSFRVIKTDKRYLIVEAKHRADFKQEVLDYIENKHKEFEVVKKQFLSKPIEAVSSSPLPSVAFPELNDASSWNKDMKSSIIDGIYGLYEEAYVDDKPFQLLLIMLLRDTMEWHLFSRWSAFKKSLLQLIKQEILIASEKKHTSEHTKLSMYYSNLLMSIMDTDILPARRRVGEYYA